jgi:hypothetical protein
MSRQVRPNIRNSCTACHGGNAKGGRGPDLTSGLWRSGSSDAEIVKNILAGIPNTEMPAFPMRPREAEEIVAYLRSLGPAASKAPAGDAPPGDSAAGQALFFRVGRMRPLPHVWRTRWPFGTRPEHARRGWQASRARKSPAIDTETRTRPFVVDTKRLKSDWPMANWSAA